MNLVWNLDPAAVTCSERLALLCLADHAHRDGAGAWPSVPTIMRRTSLSRRAVQNILPRLAEKNLIVKEGKMARGSVRYALNLDAVEDQRLGYVQRVAETSSRDAKRSPPPTSADEPDHPADCAPRAQSPRTTCADDSPSGDPDDCAPDARGGAPRAQGGARGAEICAPRAPDPDLNRHEPSEKKYPRADARSRSYAVPTDRGNGNELRHPPDQAPTKTTAAEAEAAYQRLKQLAAEVVHEQPAATHEQHCNEVHRRAAAMALTPDGHHVGLAVTRCRQHPQERPQW